MSRGNGKTPCKKTPFAQEIRDALVRHGHRQKWLARALGMEFSTLRAHLQRNHFYLQEAAQIAAILNLSSGKDLAVSYEFEVIPGKFRGREGEETLQALFRDMNRDSARVQRACMPVRETFLRAVGKLGENDLMVLFSATVTPMEMEETRYGGDIRAMIANSIRRGGTFIYIRPTATVIGKYTKLFNLRRVVPFDQQVSEYTDFQRELTELVERQSTTIMARELVERRTIQLYVERSPFWSPGVVFGLLRTFDEDGQAVDAVSIRSPGDAAFVCWDHELTAARLVSTAETHLRDWLKKNLSENENAAIEHSLSCLREFTTGAEKEPD